MVFSSLCSFNIEPMEFNLAIPDYLDSSLL